MRVFHRRWHDNYHLLLNMKPIQVITLLIYISCINYIKHARKMP